MMPIDDVVFLKTFEIVAPANQIRDLQTRTAAFAHSTGCGKDILQSEYIMYYHA
jgi:hypothetical protein